MKSCSNLSFSVSKIVSRIYGPIGARKKKRGEQAERARKEQCASVKGGRG